MSRTSATERPEKETVVDPDGVEKTMIGRPAGFKDFDIPTGELDLDWRCPLCGDVGLYRRTGPFNPSCTNLNCPVDRYSPFVRERYEEVLPDGR